MAVATSALEALNKITHTSSNQNQIERKKPHLLSFDTFVAAQGTDTYCERAQPTVDKPEFSFISD